MGEDVGYGERERERAMGEDGSSDVKWTAGNVTSFIHCLVETLSDKYVHHCR